MFHITLIYRQSMPIWPVAMCCHRRIEHIMTIHCTPICWPNLNPSVVVHAAQTLNAVRILLSSRECLEHITRKVPNPMWRPLQLTWTKLRAAQILSTFFSPTIMTATPILNDPNNNWRSFVTTVPFMHLWRQVSATNSNNKFEYNPATDSCASLLTTTAPLSLKLCPFSNSNSKTVHYNDGRFNPDESSNTNGHSTSPIIPIGSIFFTFFSGQVRSQQPTVTVAPTPATHPLMLIYMSPRLSSWRAHGEWVGPSTVNSIKEKFLVDSNGTA
jgi:hypothetical protein